MLNEKCKLCKSRRTRKFGFYRGLQCYYCNICGHKFIANGKFARMRVKSDAIIMAIDLYYQGASLRKVQRFLRNYYDVKVSQVSVWRWIIKYSQLVKKYTDRFKMNTDYAWHTDEMVLHCKGKYVWFWSVLDLNSRFILGSIYVKSRSMENAMNLFKICKDKTIELPETIVSDGLLTYPMAIKKVFGLKKKTTFTPHYENKVKHINLIKFTGELNNNIIERFQGSLRDRYRVMRGFKNISSASAIMDGMIIDYNFLRPHLSLGGQTPAQMIGLDLNLRDRWRSLIEMAYKNGV